MRGTHLLLALLSVLTVPSLAYPEEYAVRFTPTPAARAKMVLAFSSLGSSSLQIRRELRNLPGTVIVKMTPAVAARLAEEGYEIEFLPRLRAVGLPWMLDRENQRTLPLDGDDSRPFSGRGVRIFILDSGIFKNPDEFGDRLSATDYLGDGKGAFATCGELGTHATGITSIAAGNVYGVAPGASISLMRVVGCDGFVDGGAWFEAMDDVATWKRENSATPAVMNMSFGGPGLQKTEDDMFKVLTGLGVVLVDSAANDNADACTYGPAGSPYTITVGASDIEDQKPTFSNWGTCVDLFAPGMNVPQRAGEGTQEWGGTGTSDSAPAVAGTIALMFEQLPDLNPAEVRKALLANATAGVMVGDLGKGSPNLLLYDGPLQEEVSRLIPRWFPSEHRFTTQVGVSLNGHPTPFGIARLFRGPAKDGHCQGQPFATVTLVNGSGVSNIVGWQQAPAFVCVETRAGTVYERFVRTL